MFRQAVCASLRCVNRVGPGISSPRWAGFVLSHTRTYTVPSPEPLSSSPTGATPLPAQPWPPLPALPEVPPVDSDFSQYLETLHEYGWRRTTFRRDEQKYVALKQEFRFRSPLDLKAFIEKTRNTAASILLRRNLRQCRLTLDDPDGVTWSTIRSAHQAAGTILSPLGPAQPLAPIPSATLPSPPPPPAFPLPSIHQEIRENPV
ncbi:hypothetical protein DFH09DRAFT_1286534 [Mycena vulgaris]|nr:hypothetical protein DFH09DRAFT_1286534 [Mycena vulgaris]